MQMNKRFFLRGALSVAATSLLAPIDAAFPAIPTIVGDGIHDDGPGLNALLNGLPVNVLNDCCKIIRGDGIHLKGGTFLIGQTIRISSPKTCLESNTFIPSPNFKDDCMICFEESALDSALIWTWP